MATFDLFRPNPKSAPGPAASLFGRLAAWNDRRLTRDALSRLSDHELDDIGLTRADLDAGAPPRRR